MRNNRILFRVSIFVFMAVSVLLWFAFRPQADFTLTVMDVGQGDSILLHARTGEDMIVDGGPNDRVLAQLGSALPLGDRSIELMVLTHPHADHYAGLTSVLNRYTVGRILLADTPSTSEYFLRWKKRALQKPHTIVKMGDVFHLGSATVTVLWPASGYTNTDPNETSVVLRVDIGRSCALLMGDAGFPAEGELLKEQARVRCDVLKVGHHGSAQASGNKFLAAVKPLWAVISDGQGNRYGHPTPSALARLVASGAAVWRTDQRGTFRWLCTAGGDCHVGH